MEVFEVCIFADVLCCTTILCIVMMMFQVEIIVKYSIYTIDFAGVTYFDALLCLVVKRYSRSGAVMEIDFFILRCICYGIFSM